MEIFGRTLGAKEEAKELMLQTASDLYILLCYISSAGEEGKHKHEGKHKGGGGGGGGAAPHGKASGKAKPMI